MGALADLVRRAQRGGQRVLDLRVEVLVDGDPPAGGLELTLELRDAERKLAHPGSERADHVVGGERRAPARAAGLSQRSTPLRVARPSVRKQGRARSR